MPENKSPFLETLFQLRTLEQIILFNEILSITKKECEAAIDFLESEYERESLNYPYDATPFHQEAALWGAKTVYYASQLLLNRQNTIAEIETFLLDFPNEVTPSAMLSADLTLRFLPQLFMELKQLDDQDKIIPILEKMLFKFHYSVIGYSILPDTLEIQEPILDPCFLQMYLNRIVERKDFKVAEQPFWKSHLNRNFGEYKQLFWNEL